MGIDFLSRMLRSRLFGLITKEARQTLRNKHLLFLLLFPPTIQLLILGASLDPAVHNLDIGIVDYSRTQMSRDLISAIAAGGMFKAQDYVPSEHVLQTQLQQAKIKAGLVIAPDFNKDLLMRHLANVQVVIDGVDAYTAGIASSYLQQMILNFHPTEEVRNLPVQSCTTTLYNPGLKSSWYFVPGVLGALLTLTGTLVSSAALLREKEVGTLEQLLMTPYATWEILFAKTVPIFLLLMADLFLAVFVALIVFGLPFRGSFALFVFASALYICVAIGFGMMLATLCQSQRQAQLASFFINIPLIQLSGAVVPFETMPTVLRDVSALDPLRYYTVILRSLLLKGAGLETLWPSVAMLALSAGLLLTFSLVNFRRQLS